ncbi:pyruvate ferredoxin oxidoreductase [Candidatus Pacearchaeota archaeon]|nr:pyruvate ferredoxin oxidoreductase [Candidatus Pacearchaeota archaeon]
MASLKELAKNKEILTGGHRLCAGCGAGIVVRQIMLTAGPDVVVAMATGCLEVSTTIYPYTAWQCSCVHTAFENSAATISGVEAAYQALKRKGKVSKEIKFIAFGGDGGTYDIGLQSLSGALERGHKFLYVCYDNGAYMNTGIQRSSATPMGAWSTTSPPGKVSFGKKKWRKDLTQIALAHNVEFVAQASPSNWKDLTRKVEKALSKDGATFINIISPCHRGWRYPQEKTVELAKLAVDTCYWPLYEVDEGVMKINYKPKEKKKIEEWLKPQGRFKHLFKEENRHVIDEFQRRVDKEWDKLLRMEKLFNKEA